MVDYDSDEDEDEDEDDDEEDAGEDEDVVDEDDEGEEALEEGLLSPSGLKDIEGNAKANMNEDITLNTSIKGDNATKDANIVLNSSLPSVTASTNQPITSNENITEMKNVGKDQVDSKEELARLSDKLPDTHESQQSSKEDCTYSIEKSNLEGHNKQTELKEEHVHKTDGELEKKTTCSEENKTLAEDDQQNIRNVTDKGDAEKVIDRNPLIRSNEDLSDCSDDRPLAKRQKLCSDESQEGAGDMSEKDSGPVK